MDRPAAATDGSGLPTWLSSLGFCALLAWHGLLTLALFGPEPWETLTNDEPIVSGVHAQKQYIGQLGAHAILHHGRTFVYDDRFQIGWPKTPIFDGGRLAELAATIPRRTKLDSRSCACWCPCSS
jgi:hypothetical protein